MTKTGKRNLKLVSATAMCLFSLASAFVGTYAWFESVFTNNQEADDFEVKPIDTSVKKIYFFSYYGEDSLDPDTSTHFGFNPTPYCTLDFRSDGTVQPIGSPTIDLGTYSLDDPNHPVLILFEVEGQTESITLKTDYSFLCEEEPTSTVTVASYSALGTYADGTIIQVTADEQHNGLKTKYEYVIPAEGDPYFDMVWCELTQDKNPLSSVIESHSFTFAEDPSDVERLTNLDLYIDDGYGHKSVQSRDCISITKSEMTDANRASFASFTSNGNFEGFEKEVIFFEGDISEVKYVGPVINYLPSALEYISYFYLGHEYLSDGLEFKCDWKTEV